MNPPSTGHGVSDLFRYYVQTRDEPRTIVARLVLAVAFEWYYQQESRNIRAPMGSEESRISWFNMVDWILNGDDS